MCRLNTAASFGLCSAGDWTDMPGDLLLSRLTKPNSSGAQLRTYGNLLRPLTTELYSTAARVCWVLGLTIGMRHRWVVTVGGLAASELSGIGAYLWAQQMLSPATKLSLTCLSRTQALVADEQGGSSHNRSFGRREALRCGCRNECGGSPGHCRYAQAVVTISMQVNFARCSRTSRR